METAGSESGLLVLYVQLYVKAQVVVAEVQHRAPVSRYIDARSKDEPSSFRVGELSDCVCISERSGYPLFRDRIQIVFAAIWGFLFFSEVPDLLSIVGALLVVAGTVVVARSS